MTRQNVRLKMIRQTSATPNNAMPAPLSILSGVPVSFEASDSLPGTTKTGKIPAEYVYQAATLAAALLVLMSV
jgi:hypothetical protein